MRICVAMAGVWCAGCGTEEPVAPRYWMADMHGLEPDAGWVWRLDALGGVDSGRAAALDEALLVWARHDGDGGIEMRQGTSWSEAAPWGWLRFLTPGGDLVLAEWDLPVDSGGRLTGSGRMRMADAEASHGDLHTSGKVQCETLVNEGAQTFFGSFESTITLACTGPTDRPVGRWVFAREVGLVQLRSANLRSLDLVRRGW